MPLRRRASLRMGGGGARRFGRTRWPKHRVGVTIDPLLGRFGARGRSKTAGLLCAFAMRGGKWGVDNYPYAMFWPPDLRCCVSLVRAGGNLRAKAKRARCRRGIGLVTCSWLGQRDVRVRLRRPRPLRRPAASLRLKLAKTLARFAHLEALRVRIPLPRVLPIAKGPIPRVASGPINLFGWGRGMSACGCAARARCGGLRPPCDSSWQRRSRALRTLRPCGFESLCPGCFQ